MIEFEEALGKRTAGLEAPAEKKSIFQILQKRYPANEYALMREVRDKAGFDASRSADYIAVSLWPSRGLSLNGIELKSYRSDWLNELKKPEKAENIFQYCDYFWLLTAGDGVANIKEIPDTWGWLAVKGERIVVIKEAPKLEPKPITRSFLCAMLKRACDKTEFIHVDNIKARIDEARESAIHNKEYKHEQILKERDELAKILIDFKNASGIDLRASRWDSGPKKIGEAVKFLQSGGVEAIKTQLFGLEETAKKVLSKISEGLKL